MANVTLSDDEYAQFKSLLGKTSPQSDPQAEPEPEWTVADTLRTLVHYGRLPDEMLQRKCLAAIDKHYAPADAVPVTSDNAT